jgi:hypothetical protein
MAACLISVLMLALAGVTRFGARLQGAWRVIYVVSAGAALYFNLLIGVAGASSRTEPSLLVAQFAVVLPFVGVTVAIIKRHTLFERGVQQIVLCLRELLHGAAARCPHHAVDDRPLEIGCDVRGS